MDISEEAPPDLPTLAAPPSLRLSAEATAAQEAPLRISIARDFAYSPTTSLFLRLDEPPPSDTHDTAMAERRTAALEARRAQQYQQHLQQQQQQEDVGSTRKPDNAARGVVGGEGVDDPSSGWTDPPPWLAPANLHDGLALLTTASEEDLGEGEVHGRAVALFDFTPEHENEFALVEGQQVFISSMHGLGWLVAVDPSTSDCGLVPEEYVRFLGDDEVWALQSDGEGEEDAHDLEDHVGKGVPTTDSEADDGWVDESHDTESTSEKPDKALTEDERAALYAQAEREMAQAEHHNLEDDIPV